MKKLYLFILLFILTLGISAQNNFVSTNNNLWSNTANWADGTVPNSNGVIAAILTGNPRLDGDFTVQRLSKTGTTTATVSGESLTIDANLNSGFYQGIVNATGGAGAIFTISGSIKINNTGGNGNTSIINNGSGSANQIVFSSTSVLNIITQTQAGNANGEKIVFDGILLGGGENVALRIGSQSKAEFGPNSNNSAFLGSIVMFIESSIDVNTADNGVFIPVDQKLQINGNNTFVKIMGKNTFKGNLSVGGSNTFTLDLDANQNSMQTISLGSGTLNLDIDNTITEVNFASNSENDWGSAVFNITGYKEGVLRFGTDNTGLTTAQLAQIVVDGVSDSVGLNNDGYLVNKTSLSVDDFNESVKPIAYPTLTSSKIFFSKPQNNVKIINLNGQVLRDIRTENQEEISVDFLSTGLYLIVFDNKKTEKFIKN